MRYLLVWILVVMVLGCAPEDEMTETVASFEAELLELKSFFHIPGLAVLVKEGDDIIFESYLGYADLDNQVPLDSSMLFPVASVTKTFASIVALQLIEQNQLSLDTPVLTISPNADDTVRVKHVLSHTSQGEIGKHFLYSYRYGQLTRILEDAGGMPFEDLLQERIIDPLALTHTVPFTSDSLLSHYNFAVPYTFYGTTEQGNYDPGVSASSGVASTVRDLARFDQAIDHSELVDEERSSMLMRAFDTGNSSPYGLGIFVQHVMGEKVIWGYGQEDSFSSLLLKVPDRNMTLILLANNNLMSDPPRLINGDVTYSLFALNFLKHFVFETPENLQFTDYQAADLEKVEDVLNEYAGHAMGPFYRQELLAQAIAHGFLGQGDPSLIDVQERLLRRAFAHFPNYTAYGHLTLLHSLMSITTQRELEDLQGAFVELGEHLLGFWEEDPYANIYLGFYYTARGDDEEALPYYHRVADAPNFSPFWYTLEAWNFLGSYYQNTDPQKARTYLQRIIDHGWNYAGSVDRAREALERMDAQTM